MAKRKMTTAPGYYIYLISSLPMLHFGLKAPFAFEKFIAMCKGLIPEEDIETLKRARVLDDDFHVAPNPTLVKWHIFDTVLRNELVKIRASRRHADPYKYLRRDGYAEPAISVLALNAYKTPSIMQAERILDEERWKFLDELTVGHYFDLDYLVTYSLKLLILEKWDKVYTGDKEKILEETLGKA
jgi:hypothetical protein